MLLPLLLIKRSARTNVSSPPGPGGKVLPDGRAVNRAFSYYTAETTCPRVDCL